MKLDDIGFYTLSDRRAMCADQWSPLERCELVLTGRCNFNCPYCRGVKHEYRGDMPWHEAAYIVTQWQSEGLVNIRFSGGEPTLYRGLPELVSLAKKSCSRIALSTNGTGAIGLYDELIGRGVDDISVSLDACCSGTCDKMAGRDGMFEKLMKTIRHLASRVYVTAGVVLTPENIGEAANIAVVASELGVKDIRFIPAAQWRRDNVMEIPPSLIERHPILRYRVANTNSGRSVRGLGSGDSHRCYLALDDMAVIGTHHYPCIIYLREQGAPIGEFNTIGAVRRARAEWSEEHDCFSDSICSANCLDVCIDYNNRVRQYREEEKPCK